ncbi:putative component of type VI protein secretion system [Sphingomonas endophytica]|uniref:Putative component of type VI protein secretion system n=1 Tax=Sphingomonas endophytica TaxID=869719 RepID=A0A7X0MNV3_9SPHN|nr:hypothetical protein [Sphingomonas endophytica]MBB6503853.1 putative component of type VI protein secretion system [Sphingomonas endophytica]
MKAPLKDKAAVERQQAEQTRQRVRVGMIGLAAVVLLIGLASAIFSSVNQQQPVNVTGAAQPELVANMSAPSSAPTNEPLAEMGVTPGAAPTPAEPQPQPQPQPQAQPQPAPDTPTNGML